MAINNGGVALTFIEGGISSNGTKTPAMREPSYITVKRTNAEKAIIQIAKSKDQPIGVVISKIISQSIPQLQKYVQARGEVPEKNMYALAVQAALLRAVEIATVAQAVDRPDSDAMEIIESAESQAVYENDPDTQAILSPDVAGAIAFMLYRIADRYRKNGGSGSLVDFANSLRRSVKADSFDKVCCADYATGNVLIYTPEQDAGTTEEKDGSFWDDMFKIVDKVVDGIGKVKDAIGDATQQTGGIVDQIKNIGSDIGGDSIGKFLAKNWWQILLGILVLVLLIIFIARATRK